MNMGNVCNKRTNVRMAPPVSVLIVAVQFDQPRILPLWPFMLPGVHRATVKISGPTPTT